MKKLHSVLILEESLVIDLLPPEQEATTAPWLLPDYLLVAPNFLLNVPESQMQSFALSDETPEKTSQRSGVNCYIRREMVT